MRIQRSDSLAVVIDIQERLFPHMHNKEVLLENTGILLQGLKVLEIPVLITEQYTKGLGFTVPEIRKELMDSPFLEKTSFSCCDDQDFMDSLKAIPRKNVIVFGIEAHVCVLQTVTDLVEQAYQPVVIEDCVSSRKLNDKNIAIERMRQEGAIISSYESILFELARVSGTDKFKAISKLVK